VIVRAGLEQLLGGTDVEIVGQTAESDEVVRLAAHLRPDVVLLEVRLGPTDGLGVLEQLRAAAPDMRVVLFSACDNPTYVARAIALGALDYVVKTASRADILAAIAAASSERATLSPRLASLQAAMRSIDPGSGAESGMTERELQVVRHLGMGLSNREIGYSLGISVETVKEHVQNILRKLKATDRTQAAVWALKKGMV
jgi:DNA-binding NarL/FixJ family response regulator